MNILQTKMPLPKEKTTISDNENVINNEYLMDYQNKLGSGHFGHTFKGISIKSKIEYAIKIEQNDTLAPQLENEYALLRELRGQPGIPNVYYFKDHGQDKTMVIDLLGPNLEEVLQNTKRKSFSMKTVLMIGDHLLNILHCIHEKEVIHRDLKPENMAIGLHPRQFSIFLIDFGLSSKYVNSKTNEHMQYRDKKPFSGTPMFASTFTHLGIEQSRRDDLESLGYILVYFALGELPWNKIKGKSQEDKLEKIMNAKCNCRDNGVLSKNLPEEFQLYFDNVFKLGFAEKPNYLLLRGLLNTAMSKLGVYIDNIFDWCNEDLNENPVLRLRELREKKQSEYEAIAQVKEKNDILSGEKNINSIKTTKSIQQEVKSKILFSPSKQKEDKKRMKQSHSLKGKNGPKQILEAPLYCKFIKKTSK